MKKDIDIYMRELIGSKLVIMPITDLAIRDFKDQLFVLEKIILEMQIISKNISKEINSEINHVLDAVKEAKNSKALFFSVELDKFKRVHEIFRDSFLEDKVLIAAKSDLNTNNLELIYLRKINEIFEKFIN